MNVTRLLNRAVWLPFIAHPPRLFRCEICAGLRLMVRTNADESIGSRCLSCRGTVFHRGMFKVLRDIFGADLERLNGGSVYEVSAHGALYQVFLRLAPTVGFTFTGSEFLDGWQPGQIYDGVRCENLESLTFADRSFDLVTSSGLMEHVENDAAAYREVHRVLKPGGYYIFTIPYFPGRATRAIAWRRNGVIEYDGEPEYHADPFRGYKVLTWRHYGDDLVDTLRAAGLSGSVIGIPVAGYTGKFPVVVARR
jgi:SAM-dependent methyltransferase